jgi:hypothetical protein
MPLQLDIPEEYYEPKPFYRTRDAAQAVLREIKDHIKATGEPHAWRHHTHTKPVVGSRIDPACLLARLWRPAKDSDRRQLEQRLSRMRCQSEMKTRVRKTARQQRVSGQPRRGRTNFSQKIHL